MFDWVLDRPLTFSRKTKTEEKLRKSFLRKTLLGNGFLHSYFSVSFVRNPEAVSQYSQENSCAGSLFNKAFNLKKRLQDRCFPVNITKFLRTPILKNICEQLLL